MNIQKKKQITLEVNSLEDAFVNIGMEEENKKVDLQDNQEKFTDFNSIPVPYCVQKAPKFIFFNQLLALFLRRLIVSMKSISMIFTFIFPLLVQIGGVILTKSIQDDTLINPKEISENKFNQFFLNSAFQILSYSLTMAGIAAAPVIDNEYKLRYALNVMGCRNTPYWFGAFIFDVLVMFSMFGVFIIFVPILSLEILEENLAQISSILIVSIFTFIGFSYLFSFIYSKSKWVYITYPFVIFFVFYAGLQALFVNVEEDNISLKYFLCVLSPFLATSNSFISLAFSIYLPKLPVCPPIPPYDHQQEYFEYYRKYQPGENCIEQGQTQEDPAWMKIYPGSMQNYKNYIWILLVQGIFYIALAIIIDYLKQQLPNRALTKEDYSEIEKDQSDIAEEVSQEDARVANPQCQDKIKVSKLYKTYHTHGKPFTAIQNNSFGINSGEVMGLLGPNGAGKSTTFNIITSLITKSAGSVKLKGEEVKSGALDVYQDVGICPQFDSLYENLTVQDHLNLFGRMKGLSGKELKESVDYFINIMQLKDYRFRKAGNLSGGNKRKLCVTIALIGGPDMQFFDEPSSGVDPIARRFLWNTLKQSLKLRNSAIVLTTHSMQEAESLCSKIGILVNGKFQCIGSPDFLKKKYGEGYRLIAKTKTTESANYISQYILSRIPESKISSKYDGKQISFSIPYHNFSFYSTYEILHKLANVSFADLPPVNNQMVESTHNRDGNVVIQIQDEDQILNNKRINNPSSKILESYQLTEITLEQIFVHFSQQQKAYDEEKEKKIKSKKFFCF